MSRHRRSIYVEDELYTELEKAAGVNGRSTNAEICHALRVYLGEPAKSRPRRAPAAKPTNTDAVRLVELLEAEVRRNGRPEHLIQSASWYTPARLLLERDGRDVVEAGGLIEWATRHPFWRANVLSMDTFRRQYDTLRLQRDRNRPRAATPGTGGVEFQSAWLARRFPRADAKLVARLVREFYEDRGHVPTAEELAPRLEVVN